MSRSARSGIVLVAAVAVPAGLAFGWGLWWARGGYPECGGGSWFLADAGWLLAGTLLGGVVGLALPIVIASWRGWSVAAGVLLAAGVAMVMAADAGATRAAMSVGCDPWYVRDAGQAVAVGLGVGGVPTIVVGSVLAGRRRARDRPPGGDPPAGDPTADPAAGWRRVGDGAVRPRRRTIAYRRRPRSGQR